MSQIGLNLNRIKSKEALDRYKKFVFDSALITQEKIKQEVSLEEAKITEKITKDVSMVKNDIACQLDDLTKGPDKGFSITVTQQQTVSKLVQTSVDIRMAENDGDNIDQHPLPPADDPLALYDLWGNADDDFYGM